MPLYSYQCPDCHTTDKRIAGVDDHTALCVKCDGLMLRTDNDIWTPLWDEAPKAKTKDSP